MKKLYALVALVSLFAILVGCAPAAGGTTDVVTGVTITGDGVTGTGASKEATVTIGTPLDLGVTITKSGSPDVTESWVAAGADITVVATTGVVSGVTANATGVTLTVTVGGKSASITIKVIEADKGLVLGFDQTSLEFQTIPATASTAAPTVLKSAANVLTLTNTDGSYKETATESIQGSSYLLYKTPITGDFEVKAAVKISGMPLQLTGDKYCVGVGIITTDASGNVTIDSQSAFTTIRDKSTPDARSMWTKSNTYNATSNTSGWVGGGNPNITSGVDITQYHLLKATRIGNNFTFEINGTTATVTINTVTEGTGTATGEIWSTLAGSGKVGIMFAGVQATVEGLTISTLDGAGTASVQYNSGTLPDVPFDVSSILVTGPGSSSAATTGIGSATLDMAGAAPKTYQLTTVYTPTTATVGNSVTYTVSDGDANVTVDAAGLVTATGMGDGSATITATSGNLRVNTFILTIVDSTSTQVSSVSIPATLSLGAGKTQTLTATVLPSTATDKTVTWASTGGTAITVDSAGLVSVAAGTAAGTTANITATSVQVATIVSNTCVVTVAAPTGVDSTTYFDTLSDGTALAAGIFSTAYQVVHFANGLDLQVGSSTTATKTDASTQAIGTITATRRLSIDKYRSADSPQLALTVPVLGNCAIKVGVQRDGIRTIDATTASGTLDVATYPCPTTATEVVFNYTGGAGSVVLNTINTAGSIYIFYIFVDYP